MLLLSNDLILRPLAIAEGARQYVLVDAVTLATVAGPFEELRDATHSARTLGAEHRVTVWVEQVDDRGRRVGGLMRLFSLP